MDAAIDRAVADGNIQLANEITANVMVGTTLLICFTVMLLALVLNELRVFTADKILMRWAVAAAAFVEVPITILNTKYVGLKPWLKIPLMVDLILVCGILSATLGHNVTLVMILPVIVSTRYFDKKYTLNVAVFTAIVFAAASIINGYFGIMNLNMIKGFSGSAVTLEHGADLRETLIGAGIDKAEYIKSLFVNDFIPRCLIFFALSSSCYYVSSRGRRMIEMESSNVQKTSRIETELDLATKIQVSMLPCLFPAFPDHENLDLRAYYHPAKEVGGDFYDYFIIDKSHIGVVIADVSGKGVGAALFMAISKTVLKNQLQLGLSPEEAIKNANKQLCENNESGLFVTCWAGVYDIDTGVLTFVNAGHNPPVLIRKGQKPEFIKQRSGFVLAGFEGFQYKQEELKLESGDEMFFYTDGVTEAIDCDEQLFGDARLLESIEKHKGLDINEQLVLLKNDIDGFAGKVEQFDDITVMALRIS